MTSTIWIGHFLATTLDWCYGGSGMWSWLAQWEIWLSQRGVNQMRTSWKRALGWGNSSGKGPKFLFKGCDNGRGPSKDDMTGKERTSSNWGRTRPWGALKASLRELVFIPRRWVVMEGSRQAVIFLPAEGVHWPGARGGRDLRRRC